MRNEAPLSARCARPFNAGFDDCAVEQNDGDVIRSTREVSLFVHLLKGQTKRTKQPVVPPHWADTVPEKLCDRLNDTSSNRLT